MINGFKKKKKIFFASIAFFLSTVFGLILVEILLRVNFYLHATKEYEKCPRFYDHYTSCRFLVWNKLPIKDNPITGGDHLKNTKYIRAEFIDNKFMGCEYKKTNYQGQFSKLKNTNEFTKKILILGDSLTTYNHNSITWPYLLKRKIKIELGENFYINNLARSGIGILQMHDIARNELSKNNYDLVIFAYISDDLDRARTWKQYISTSTESGYIIRHYNKDFTLKNYRHIEVLIDKKLNKETCEDLKKDDLRNNKFYNDNLMKYKEISKKDFYLKYSVSGKKEVLKKVFLSKKVFIMNFLNGANFYNLLFGTKISQHKFTNKYSDYLKLLKSINNFKDLKGTKIIYIHVPIYDEIIQKNYYEDQKFVDLKSELQEISKKDNILHMDLLKKINVSKEEAQKIPVNLKNQHPSMEGLKIYTNNIFEAILDEIR